MGLSLADKISLERITVKNLITQGACLKAKTALSRNEPEFLPNPGLCPFCDAARIFLTSEKS